MSVYWPEKAAGKKRYRVRRNPVTHLIEHITFVRSGLRVAQCCQFVGRPRHDDGYSFDSAVVDCERCIKSIVESKEKKT